jgi:hypothetical protein
MRIATTVNQSSKPKKRKKWLGGKNFTKIKMASHMTLQRNLELSRARAR